MTNRAPAPGAVAARTARAGLLVLTLVNMFNYLDRWVVSALVESLKKSPLALTDTQLGALMPGFLIVYMLTSPLFGSLGDRRNRPRVMAVGVAIWSVATALGGFAWNFVSLFAARATVGIGEAAYGTISPALLAAYFPKERRGRVFAVFFSAIPIGSALGYILGGYIDTHLGWREAFFIAGAPGLLLAILAWRLVDPPRGSQDEDLPAGHIAGPRPTLAAYRALVKNRPFFLTSLGYAAFTFAIGALAFWTPAFLERMRGLSHTAATQQFGAIVVVTGFLGTFAGGWLGDYFLKYTKQSYLMVSGVATLAAVPFTVMALVATQPVFYFSAIVLAELLLFASTGPINSASVNLVSPYERATASAFMILAIHVLGDVPSPLLVGAISDHSDLGRAMLIVPVAVALSGVIWLWAARAWAAQEQATAPAGS